MNFECVGMCWNILECVESVGMCLNVVECVGMLECWLVVGCHTFSNLVNFECVGIFWNVW